MLSTTFRAAALVLTIGGLAACTQDPLNTAGRPDGAPGNPPGTEVSRANQRAGDPLNTADRPDGTRGNPPGTAVSRANERAGDPLNTAGRPDCTPGNPPGTAVSRTLGTTDRSDCGPAQQRSRR
ncbi:hypothetical protein [Roseomonas xinghualingensis]|uniref:hypothetical protein n=1 Tax=Roseomonas xinghualingensis TaxID=2986475 RepID=UPI0021F0F80B|nr:hypothetical protein [Roseomonas sp. SXEYE001]MCV4206478.1 hypothetical protein [Roseomonas sp. SXEYE001]